MDSTSWEVTQPHFFTDEYVLVAQYCKATNRQAVCTSSSPINALKHCNRPKCAECVKFCSHTICDECMSFTLDSYRKTHNTEFVFQVAEDAVYGEKTVKGCDIQCPVAGCKFMISYKMLTKFAAEDEGRLYRQLDDQRSWRKCCFSELMYCGELEPLDNLVQFGCGHFYHADCVIGDVKVLS